MGYEVVRVYTVEHTETGSVLTEGGLPKVFVDETKAEEEAERLNEAATE